MNPTQRVEKIMLESGMDGVCSDELQYQYIVSKVSDQAMDWCRRNQDLINDEEIDVVAIDRNFEIFMKESVHNLKVQINEPPNGQEPF